MSRVKGWEQAAVALFKAHARTPHEWGQHDCAIFAARAVAALTGVDHSAPFVGAYSDEPGAAQVLASLGLATVGDLPGHFGLVEIEPGQAVRGDVLLLDGRLGPLLAVQWYPDPVAPGPRGVQPCGGYTPLRAWRV